MLFSFSFQSQSVSGVKIIGFNSPLYYANGDMFAKQVYRTAGITLEKRRKQLKKLGRLHTSLTNRLVSMSSSILWQSNRDIDKAPYSFSLLTYIKDALKLS